jgi:hypothetical protein
MTVLRRRRVVPAAGGGAYAHFSPSYTLPYDENDNPLVYNSATGLVEGTVFDTSWHTRAWWQANAATVKTVKASGGDYTGAQFATALSDAATANDIRVIVVDSGLVVSGTFSPPEKSGTPEWTLVCSSDWWAGTWAPTGQRYVDVDTETAHMAELRCGHIVDPVLSFDAKNKSKWAFVGIIFRRSYQRLDNGDDAMYGIVRLRMETEPSVVTDLPNNHIFQWCWFDGVNRSGGLFYRTVIGLYFESYKCAVLNTQITGIGNTATDTQAIGGSKGGGRLKVIDSLLEATGENFMSGGNTPNANFLPSDFEFRRVYFPKRQEWNSRSSVYYAGQTGYYAPAVKNNFEFKHGLRLLVEASVFENCWLDGQTGYGVLLKVTNQYNTTVDHETRDCTFLHCVIKNVGTPIGTSYCEYGAGDSPFNSTLTRPLNRFEFINCLGVSDSTTRIGAAQRRAFDIAAGLGGEEFASGADRGPFKIRWSTFASRQSDGFGNVATVRYEQSQQGAVMDCVIDYSGGYGIGSDNQFGVSATALTGANVTMARNALAESPTGRWLRRADFESSFPDQYTAGLWSTYNSGDEPRPEPSNWFADRAAGDWRPHPSASYRGLGADGRDPGCDHDLLESVTSGVANAPSFITVEFV